MKRSRLLLLSLCALMLGTMAFAAGVGQAEKGAKWIILDSNGIALDAAALSASLAAEAQEAKFSISSTIFGASVDMRCTALQFIGFKLEKEGSLTNGASIQFTGCFLELEKEVAPECKLHSSGKPTGTILTNSLKGLLILHEGQALIRLEPSTGSSFFTLLLGSECPIGETLSFSGILYLKDAEGKATSHLVTHRFEEGPLTVVKLFNEPAEVIGKIGIFLTGAHAGLKWAAFGTAKTHEEELKHESELHKKQLEHELELHEIELHELELHEEELAKRWLVIDKGGTALDAAKLGASISAGISSEDVTVSGTVLGAGVDVKCTALTTVGMKLAKGGSLASGGKLRFTGCSVDIEGKAALECEVHSKGSLVGTVETSPLKSSLVLYESESLAKLDGEATETLVSLRLGEFCPLGEELALKGTVYLKDSSKEAKTHLALHAIGVDALTALTLGGAAATIKGSAVAYLTGEHLNYLWGADS